MNFFFGLVLLITGAQCANILMVYESARKSHQIWMEELGKGLMKKGHNITMGGSFSKTFDGDDKYHPISFEGIFLTHYKFNKTEYLTSNPIQKLYLTYNYNYAICNSTYHSNGFKILWNYPKNFTFDLIIMDLTFGPCLYPLIARFGYPFTVGCTPSTLSPYLLHMFGNSGFPSYIKSPLLGPSEQDTFLNRVQNYLFTRLEIFFKNTWERRVLEKLAGSLLNGTFTFKDLEKNISLLLINENPFLNAAQPIPPNIISVGGLHIKPAEPLPGVLDLIVRNANQGIIFFTLGTDIQQNIFTKATKEVIANAFMRLVQKTVIWKDRINVDDHTFLNKSSNILFHKWLPQNDLLGHPHTKLLITTGGTLSIQEAIYHGVPVVGIPIYDDHHKNIKFITDNELGLKLDYNNLTEDHVFETINTVLQNPMYKQNMQVYSKKFKDQPQHPLHKAVYWIEYVLRHNATKGADFLTPISRNMCWLTAYSVDVEIFLSIITSLFIVLTFIVFLKYLLRSCLKESKIVKNKKNKKKLQ